MIEKIEFSISGQNSTNVYNRKEYLSYLERSKKEYFGIHSVKTWMNDNKMIVPKFKGGVPSYFWDCIINMIDSETLIISNPDDSIRYKVSLPKELIKWEEYEKYFGKDKFFKRQEYNIKFSRVDAYFEFENKFYSIIIISLEHKNEPFDAYIQERYLDANTGIFLPFTKSITRRTPNQYAYNEETINII